MSGPIYAPSGQGAQPLRSQLLRGPCEALGKAIRVPCLSRFSFLDLEYPEIAEFDPAFLHERFDEAIEHPPDDFLNFRKRQAHFLRYCFGKFLLGHERAPKKLGDKAVAHDDIIVPTRSESTFGEQKEHLIARSALLELKGSISKRSRLTLYRDGQSEEIEQTMPRVLTYLEGQRDRIT